MVRLTPPMPGNLNRRAARYPMKILAGLTRLFEASSASDRAICEAYTHNSQLQFEASDLGHCAFYEKELQRVWSITEENRKAKIAEFANKHGFRLAYYKQGALRDLPRRLHRPRHQNSRKSPRRRLRQMILACVICALAFVGAELGNAPLGWEDELGFHFGVP